MWLPASAQLGGHDLVLGDLPVHAGDGGLLAVVAVHEAGGDDEDDHEDGEEHGDDQRDVGARHGAQLAQPPAHRPVRRRHQRGVPVTRSSGGAVVVTRG